MLFRSGKIMESAQDSMFVCGQEFGREPLLILEDNRAVQSEMVNSDDVNNKTGGVTMDMIWAMLVVMRADNNKNSSNVVKMSADINRSNSMIRVCRM